MINGLNNKNNGVTKTISSKFSRGGNFNDISPRTVKVNGGNNTFNLSAEAAAPIQKISTNRILGALSDFDAAHLMPHLDFVLLASGKEIYPAGEFNRYVYFPETAVVSYVSDLADGESIETAMIGNEGAAGLSAILDSKPTMHRAIVTVGGTAWRIKTETLKQEFGRGGKLQTLLLECLNRHINEISQRLLCKSFHLMEKRLCSWLLRLQDQVKNNQLTLTHENAALLFGSHRPTITLAAQMLRKKGLIDYSRGRFYILDRKGLENSACECYSILRSND